MKGDPLEETEKFTKPAKIWRCLASPCGCIWTPKPHSWTTQSICSGTSKLRCSSVAFCSKGPQHFLPHLVCHWVAGHPRCPPPGALPGLGGRGGPHLLRHRRAGARPSVFNQGGGGIAVRNFSAISAIFPQFPQFLGGYRNFYLWEYLKPQFSEGVQNHNMWFKIHSFCFEHPFLSKFMKIDQKYVKKFSAGCWPGLDL
jgi:hypothetical protein